jgi:hypothetical protein
MMIYNSFKPLLYGLMLLFIAWHFMNCIRKGEFGEIGKKIVYCALAVYFVTFPESLLGLIQFVINFVMSLGLDILNNTGEPTTDSTLPEAMSLFVRIF